MHYVLTENNETLLPYTPNKQKRYIHTSIGAETRMGNKKKNAKQGTLINFAAERKSEPEFSSLSRSL
jgi:hypothetical protein